MAFPAVESSSLAELATIATSHAVTLPATISAGALLMILGRVPVAGTVAVTGGGWTIAQDSSDASDDVTFWMYRDTLAAGNEDGTTVTVTHGNGRFAAIALSITGAISPATQAPQSSTVAVGTSTTPDPTTCTPTGGAKDYLWVPFHGADGEHTMAASSPWPYSDNPQTAATGTAGAVGTNCRVALCTTNVNAASLDSGVFNLAAAPANGWAAWTVAVHPLGAYTKTGFGKEHG